jgi:hypothetical protein
VNNINQPRASIAALQSELAGHEVAEPSRAERRTHTEAWCQAVALQGDNLLRQALADDNPAAAFAPFMPGAPLPLAPLLASLLGAEGLAAALSRFVGEMPEGLSAKKRAERTGQIRAELDRLERMEERLIVASETAGTPIQRRGNARPEIVLELVE